MLNTWDFDAKEEEEFQTAIVDRNWDINAENTGF